MPAPSWPPRSATPAVSTVLVATTLGGVVGPNLAALTDDLAHAIGIPHLAGPRSGAAHALATVVLTIGGGVLALVIVPVVAAAC
jgi:hypothetical protein